MVEQKGKDTTHLFSIVLIGDSSVGKSCLLKKFSEPDKKTPEGHTATVGVDFVVRTITVGNEKVKLSVWDTAGQERFRSITNAYFRGSMGAMVVYDVTDSVTFDSAQHWINEFR
jgi:small GTP-binding protein